MWAPNYLLFIGLSAGITVVAHAQLNSPVVSATNAAQAAKPWGELKIQRIPLEKSDTVFLDRALRLKTPAWHFENFTPPQLVSFLESCNLSPFARAEMLETNHWTVLSNTCVVSPSHELTRKLNPRRARAHLRGAGPE